MKDVSTEIEKDLDFHPGRRLISISIFYFQSAFQVLVKIINSTIL